MDRRQQKSRAAIFSAFNRLLEKKQFSSITVQEIIDEANVGRATFYAHFETKDALLGEMCREIFDHIFSHELHSEVSHDFSSGRHGIEEKLTHLLYHLKDNKGNILGLLSGDSSELFLRYFREFLREVFTNYPECLPQGVPADFALDQVVSGFAAAVRWWIGRGMKETPEELSAYFLQGIRYHGSASGFRYEHNCVNVFDKDRSIAFYEQALGMKVLHRFSPPDAPQLELIFLIDERSGHMLELGCAPGLTRPYDLGDNMFHMAFVADDLEAAHALHEKMGCICRDDPNAEVYFIADPDGYQIEIIPPEPKERPF